jgi:hypothetical protein
MKAFHVQLVKLCHNKLPTSKITHHYDPRAPSAYILCKHENKDLHCNHPLQFLLYKAICDTSEAFKTPEALIDVLISMLGSTPSTTIIPDKFPLPPPHDQKPNRNWQAPIASRMLLTRMVKPT